MDLRYDAFRFADPYFYDTPSRFEPAGSEFAVTHRPVPGGWTRHNQDVWLLAQPAGISLPDQGWKIHVSATIDNAEKVLATVWDYCVQERIGFKFLRNQQIMVLYNGKYADRRSSGKLMTLYPRDHEQLHRALEDLDALLAGEPGPYILSDLRWRSGPLYVRYGGFVERYCVDGETGERVMAIEDPDGRLVPDRRLPTFRVPDWVSPPDFLASDLDRRESKATVDFPYQVHESLHFSNGGGIYLASDKRTGRRVVLKEARPFAGLDGEGRDAVTRLQRERHMLQQLAGLGIVPEVLDYGIFWEHHFLVQEYVEGTRATSQIVREYPFIRSDPSPERIQQYMAWALDFADQVERSLRAVHDRGIVYGDLHPANLIVRPGGGVAFLDLELATDDPESYQPSLGAPGFTAPSHLYGFDRDLYSLACLRLYMFLPITDLLAHHPSKLKELLGGAVGLFDLPAGYADRVLRGLSAAVPGAGSAAPPEGRAQLRHAISPATARTGDGDGGWGGTRAAMVSALKASVTPQRKDRIFPGDIEQFTYDGLCFAYGAAGVLYALAEAGAERDPQAEGWLLCGALRASHPMPGFYNGLHGIGYALQRVGLEDEALAVLDRAIALLPETRGTDLFGGLAGAGLNLLHFARSTGQYDVDEVVRIADRVAWLLEQHAPPTETTPGPTSRAGLLWGLSGPALLFVRLYEETGEERFLDLAASALRTDLARCRLAEDGSVQVDEGYRVLPYLATGSAGIGMVLHEFLSHRGSEEFTVALAGIRRATSVALTVNSGLFNGRAGLMLFLRHTSVTPDLDPALERHLRNLHWHAVPYGGGTAFTGDHMHKLSMDLATGTAGVLLATGAALSGDAMTLPFMSRS